MKYFMVGFLLSLSANASECRFLKADKDVENLKNFISSHGDLSSFWPDHYIDKFNYLFTKVSVNPKCAILIRPGEQDLIIETKSDISYQNTVYDFYNQLNKEIQPDLRASFESLNLESVYLQNVDMFDGMELPAEADYVKNRENLNFLLHEGFHLFVDLHQSPNFKKWKETLIFDRDDLSFCYKDPRVKETFKKEISEIKNLFKASYESDFSKARSSYLSYVIHRNERYEALKYVKIKGQYGFRDASCAEAEIRMEFTEGMPEYFANTVLMDLNIMSFDHAYKMTDHQETFYVTGSIKAYTLKKFLAERFIPEMRSMLKSYDDKQDLESLLRKTFK